MNTIGLKIDVDTYQGMKNGVPRLLAMLAEAGVKATFYLSCGPDASGRAIFHLLKNPRFLKKMLRTNAPGLYGWRTALYGTLLPSPLIALSFPEIVQNIMKQGHEVQFHAWDHRCWQDELQEKSGEWIKTWFAKGISAFEKLTGGKPTSFGAPGWVINDHVIEIVKDYGFDYLSCTRADSPFIYEGTGLVEIPSNLPCLEETGSDEAQSVIKSRLVPNGINVLPVHAEAEGGIWRVQFVKLLETLKALGWTFTPLVELKNLIAPESLAARRPQMALLPGRSFPCAV